MNYVHIKELETYQPGYKDRQHIWAKIYYDLLADDWFQGLCEIDRWRYISLIIFEVFHKKPVLLSPANVAFMGWNTKKRSIPLTLQMLQSKIDCVSQPEKVCTTDKNRIDKNRIDREFVPPTLAEIKKYVQGRNSSVDPQKFLDYFTAGKWIDSNGNPVKNWKQKLITWEQPNGRRANSKNQRGHQKAAGCSDAEAALYDNAASQKS